MIMKARKIIISVFLSMLMGTLGMNAQANLSIKDFVIMPGETKQVHIEMNNTVEIRALQVLVVLPEGVRMAARPAIVSKRSGMVLNDSRQFVEATKSMRYKLRDNGSCMIVVNADDAVPFSGTEGAIITLTLKADEDAKDFSGEMGLQDMELVYADGVTSVIPEDAVCKVDVCRGATSIENLMRDKPAAEVDVYDLNGALRKPGVSVNKLLEELNSGIYVIEGIKVYVK